MTRQFDRLQEKPQTEIDRGALNLDERALVRKIEVSGTVGISNSNSTGSFTNVYYLEGDVQPAAEVFVAENRTQLEAIDFSKSNELQTSLKRTVYDWILDALGERTLTKYETVVHEERSDGSAWLIGRHKYETHVDRRYAKNEAESAFLPPGVSLHDVFKSAGGTITEVDLRETAIEGDVREVLDLFRQAPAFPCEPTSIDGMLAVVKTHE